MPPSPPTETQELSASNAIERLLAIPEESARRSFLQQNPRFQHRDVVLFLAGEVPKIARIDMDRALQSAELARWLAELLNDDYCRGRCARATGHILQLKGRLRESLAEYDKALTIFSRLKLEPEVAITLSGSLQPLILLGDYKESRRREERARKVFKAHGDELRLARLDANLGNILHRQDRFEEALVLYRRAEQSLQRFDATDDIALVLNNVAVCHISLREFGSALETYERLRAYSEARQLHLLSMQVDYNIAYLHFLQGDHNRAIGLYQKTRLICERNGDRYHAALCDLDQSEIYLQLNQSSEGDRLARAALSQFQELKMNYEAAKAYTFLGLANCFQVDVAIALELFASARELFLAEQNWTWPAVVDLYRALALYRLGQGAEALKAVTAAQSVLGHSPLKDKAALAELLRSLLHLELGDFAAARYWGELAADRIERSQVSGLRYLSAFVLGRVRESQKDLKAANLYYERATLASQTEAKRGPAEQIKPPLSKDRGAIYHHLLVAALPGSSPALAQKPGGL